MESMAIFHLYFSAMSFVFGACVGSYLNVCVYRIPREESTVRPRSHCPHCNALIAWYDNIPLISWLVLRARCRHCGGRIAARYILVELLTASLFAWVWWRYGFTPLTPIYWLMISGLILGTFVDFEHMIIPDRVSLGGIVAGLALSAAVPAMHHASSHPESLVRALIGAAAGSGSLWLVGAIGKMGFRKDAMGLGDVKLLGAIGAFLGWQAILFVVFVSSLLGSLVGVALIVAGQKEWQSRLPFGPYLAASAVAWALGGSDLVQWYIGWVTAGLV